MVERLRSRRFWLWSLLCIASIGVVTYRYADAWNYRPTPQRLDLGRQLFEHEWQVNDELANGGDGLGPVFNAKSCAECHSQGGVGGSGANKHNVLAFDVIPTGRRRNVRTGVVHHFAVDDHLLETEARIGQLFPIIPDVVRVINGCRQEPAPFNPVAFSQINTPPLFGMGLIEGISDWAVQADGAKRAFSVLSSEFQGDFNQTKVGRVRMVGTRVGKFGWKGQVATVDDFVAAACAVEVGLTNPLQQQDLPRQHLPNKAAKLDLDHVQFRALVSYVANLPRPIEVEPTDPIKRRQVDRGREVFTEIGCAECHTPDIGGVSGVYSDFRLYVVEENKGRPSYVQVPPELEMPVAHPRRNEWKTPPLWGLADSAPYFHDGASPTIRDAIHRHAMHAEESRRRYETSPRDDRLALLAFLQTLRAPGADEALPNESASRKR